MSLRHEKWYPMVGALMAGVASYFLLKDLRPATVSTLTGHAISVAAISVGFLATAKSILVSIERTRIVELMRASGYYDDMLGYMVNAIKLWFLVAFLSGFLVLTFEDLYSPWNRVAFSAWLLFVAWAALAGYRVIAMLTEVLRRASAG
jgi:hypothetical protein